MLPLVVQDLGTLPYAEALAVQREAARARIAGELTQDVLFLVEHPPVVTLGRNAKAAHLGVSAEYLARHGIELFEVERGGDVTFHGLGQLVGYPVFDLRGLKPDLHWYLRQLEGALIQALDRLGLPATRNPGHTGVWTAGAPRGSSEPFPAAERAPEGSSGPPEGPAAPPALRKIASIGVHAREWVTWHGFALNVSTDLRYFDLMVPCGIPGVRMTSLEAELGRAVEMAEVKRQVVAGVAERFGLGAELRAGS